MFECCCTVNGKEFYQLLLYYGDLLAPVLFLDLSIFVGTSCLLACTSPSTQTQRKIHELLHTVRPLVQVMPDFYPPPNLLRQVPKRIVRHHQF